MSVVGAVVLAVVVAASAQACGYQVRAAARGVQGPERAALAIGDSTMIFAAPLLGRRGIEADAKECRQFTEGLRMVAARRRAGRLPFVVIVALGSNGPVGTGGLRRMLRAVGSRRMLALVTPRNHPGTQAAMRSFAAARPRRVVLIDWKRHSDARGGWFAGDGLHPTPGAGATGMADLFRRRIAGLVDPASLGARLPGRVAGSKGCGIVRRGASRFNVRVIRGAARIACGRARALARRAPLPGVAGWVWADLRPLNGLWREGYRRADGRVVIGLAPVPKPAAPPAP